MEIQLRGLGFRVQDLGDMRELPNMGTTAEGTWNSQWTMSLHSRGSTGVAAESA